MSETLQNKILELFGQSTRSKNKIDWKNLVKRQTCPYTNTTCFKTRKSQPKISIGTCSVKYGKDEKDIIICPHRLLERKQVFTDCLHLLTLHEPGNELHLVSEVSIPGGSVDYFLVSAKKGKVKDFVAIEFQTLDTTGTIWPERQRLLKKLHFKVQQIDVDSGKPFGMNWKMTAKTTLIQLYHKIDTLEHLGKHFVLIIQDHLLNYLRAEFDFEHLQTALIGDAFHIHAYGLNKNKGQFRLELDARVSTDAAGVAKCLGILAETKVGLETITAALEKKLSVRTLLTIDR